MAKASLEKRRYLPGYDDLLKAIRSIRFWAILGCVLVCAFIEVSLLSHDARDGDHYPRQATLNYCGRAGAVVSLELYKWFGAISLFLPCAFLILMSLWIKKSSLRAWGTYALWIAAATFWSCVVASYLEATPVSPRMPSRGGIWGLFWVDLMRRHTGQAAIAGIVVCGTLVLVFFAFSLWLEYTMEKGKKLGNKSTKSNHRQ